MIIATLTALMLLFGGAGSSFDVYRDAAAEVIKDKDRVKQIKVITKQADKKRKSLEKYFNKTSKELVGIITRPDLNVEEVNTYFDEVEKRREEFQEEMIKLRFQAKNLTSRQEWEAMYAKIK